MTAPPDLIDQLAALHDDAFGWAVACSGGNADAGADALQEAYLKVVSGRARFAGKSSLKTWWLGVVRLTSFERHRGGRRWQRIADSFRAWFEAIGESPDEPLPSGSAVDAEQLAAAMAQLPARQAEILKLVFQHDLSLTEAAAVMRVSVGSARQHYDRAKKRLRSLLGAAAFANIPAHAQ